VLDGGELVVVVSLEPGDLGSLVHLRLVIPVERRGEGPRPAFNRSCVRTCAYSSEFLVHRELVDELRRSPCQSGCFRIWSAMSPCAMTVQHITAAIFFFGPPSRARRPRAGNTAAGSAWAVCRLRGLRVVDESEIRPEFCPPASCVSDPNARTLQARHADNASRRRAPGTVGRTIFEPVQVIRVGTPL